MQNQTSSSPSPLFWFWLVIFIILLLTKNLAIIAISFCIFLWLWSRSTGTQQPAIYTLAQIDGIEGYEFEKCIKDVFEQLGYSVHHTPLSGDQGADLILTSNEGTRTAVQVIRYSYNVSNRAVQEVVASKAIHKCTNGIVVTNNYFTASAKELAQANDIGLIHRNELKKLINRISPVESKAWINKELARENLNKSNEAIIDPQDSIAWRSIGNALLKLIKYGKQ